MANSKQRIEGLMHQIRMMLYGKKNHSSIFQVFHQLQTAMALLWKQNDYNINQFQKKNDSYAKQVNGITQQMSNREKLLQQQIQKLRSELKKAQEQNYNRSLQQIDRQIQKIQKKYQQSDSDGLMELYNKKIERLKNELKAKDQIIARLRNSDSYTETTRVKSGTTAKSQTGQKLRGLRLPKKIEEKNRFDDFDGLNTNPNFDDQQ